MKVRELPEFVRKFREIESVVVAAGPQQSFRMDPSRLRRIILADFIEASACEFGCLADDADPGDSLYDPSLVYPDPIVPRLTLPAGLQEPGGCNWTSRQLTQLVFFILRLPQKDQFRTQPLTERVRLTAELRRASRVVMGWVEILRDSSGESDEGNLADEESDRRLAIDALAESICESTGLSLTSKACQELAERTYHEAIKAAEVEQESDELDQEAA